MRKSPSIMAVLFGLFISSAGAEERPPNVVVIFTDDQGYSDVGIYGAEGFETPNLDKMAAEGRHYTHWYAAQPVCSASRTALMTGCYPNRIGIHGALGPGAGIGIEDEELTMAEMFKSKDYATACFGKWHLGDVPEFLPQAHGFDEYFGIPYSNDMWPQHPTSKKFPALPLISGTEKIREVDEHDQSMMTTWLTAKAVDFIGRNREKPFFLYVPHPQPHVPLYVSERFAGTTERGLYGDVIAELDWSVGEILNAIKTNGLDENTLVIFTSDNGPWLSYGEHSGRAKGLREGKGTVWEGGVREACIMRWPGTIPAGTKSDTPAMNIDLLPTFAHLIDADLPERKIDGMNIWPLLAGEEGAENPHFGYWFYYRRNELHAVTHDKWKLVLPHGYRTLDGGTGGTGGLPSGYKGAKVTAPELYDLSKDMAEQTDVAADHPELVKKMQAFADEARAELGDQLSEPKIGSGSRGPGKVTQ